jgi:hypothetical protein
MKTIDKLPGATLPSDSEEIVVDDYHETIVNGEANNIIDKRRKSISVAISITGTDKDHRAGQRQKQSCKEVGGPSGPEPTRYGDWEKNGRCIDF